MRRLHLVLLLIVFGQIAAIGMRYIGHGGFKAPVVSRVHKLENGFRDAVR